jgi:RHS repeat-associated protein
VGLTNAAGTLFERYTYSDYGTIGIYAANGTVRSSSTYANRYTYTGREWDAELKLHHFRARWYDPPTGGFVSRDPLGYGDGMSLYRGYFGVRGVDPLGLQGHHWLPRDLMDGIFVKCDMFIEIRATAAQFVHLFTTEAGNGRVGSVHDCLHHDLGGLRGTGVKNYNDRVEEIVANTTDCCEMLTEVLSLVSEAWDYCRKKTAVPGANGLPVIPYDYFGHDLGPWQNKYFNTADFMHLFVDFVRNDDNRKCQRRYALATASNPFGVPAVGTVPTPIPAGGIPMVGIPAAAMPQIPKVPGVSPGAPPTPVMPTPALPSPRWDRIPELILPRVFRFPVFICETPRDSEGNLIGCSCR